MGSRYARIRPAASTTTVKYGLQPKALQALRLLHNGDDVLMTLYVLFFIEIETRHVQVTFSTSNHDVVFVTQQVRNLR